MANVNAPRGLLPYQLNGQPKTQEYTIASAYDTTIARGDVVELTGTGRNVAKAAAANADNLGVFWGVQWVDGQGNQHFASIWTADTVGTEIKALVVPFDNPAQLWEAQVDTIAEADVGNHYDWNVGTVDTVYGVSGLYLADSTKATTGTSIKVVGLVDRVDNAYGAYAKVRCQVVESIFYTGGAGV